MKSYDPNTFFAFLNYGPGDHTYECPSLRSLSIYCRGEEDQLNTLLAPTPFELADTRFLVSIADFSNNSTNTYYDAAIILAVDYDGLRGGSYYFEWEDKHNTVAAGRELWGYPKHFARISMDVDDAGVNGDVGLEDAPAFSAQMTFDDSVSTDAWSGVPFYPHLQVRAVPEVNGPSFQQFDIISRNTAKDFKLHSKRTGRATVSFGPEIQAAGEPLRIVETLGAEYTVGDFAATAENGTPTIVASLI